MRNIRIYAFLLLSAALLGALFWPAGGPPEPAYHGKTLSAWLESGLQHPWSAAEEQQAIRAIGKAALPHLERRMRAQYSGVMQSVMQYSDSMGLGFAGSYYHTKAFGAAGQLGLAWFGFRALGTEGLPSLRMLLREHDSALIQRVAPVLQYLGPEASPAMPELSDLLRTSPDAEVRALVAHTLNFLGSNAEITTLLAAGLADTNTQVRLNSALSLGRLEPLSFQSERAIYGGEFDGDEARSRGGISSAATNAIPALKKVLADADPNVRAAAQFALNQIAIATVPVGRGSDEP